MERAQQKADSTRGRTRAKAAGREKAGDRDERGDPDSRGPSYPISSVENALRLLLLFRDQKQLRLSDVSASLGVAHSTAHRLLAMLTQYDFVRQEEGRGAYLAGPALLEIGYGAVRGLDLRSLGRPVLDDLAAEIDETVHLAQLEGGRIRYVLGAESNRALRVADRTGQLFPAHRTATGKAILAELTVGQLDEVLTTIAGEGGIGLTLEERDQLMHELDEVRARGYSINLRVAEDIASVAIPVHDRRGLTVAAINASAPSSRLRDEHRDEVVDALRRSAGRLRDSLADI